MMLGSGDIKRRLDELERVSESFRAQSAAETEHRIVEERARAEEAAEQSARQAGDVDALRHDLADQKDRQGEIEVRLNEVVKRLGEAQRDQLESVRVVQEALASHAEAIEQLGTARDEQLSVSDRLLAHQATLGTLETAIARLARRVDIDAAEAAKTVTALLERIDRAS